MYFIDFLFVFQMFPCFFLLYFINKRCDFAVFALMLVFASYNFFFLLFLFVSNCCGVERERGENDVVCISCLFVYVGFASPQSVLCLNVYFVLRVFTCWCILVEYVVCCNCVYVVLVCVYLFMCNYLVCKCWWIQLISVIYSCI